MKILDILYEVTTIVLIYIAGFFLAKVIPIPSSLISMFLFFILLLFGILKEERYNNLARIILIHLAFFFIPPAVNIMNSIDILSGNVIKLIIVLVLSNILVMGITGLVVQFFVSKENSKDD